MAGLSDPQASTDQGWRVQATSTPSLAVLVDAWQLLDVEPAHLVYRRIDLVVERLEPDGRLYLLVTGEPSICPWRPVTPSGWTPIATLHIPAAVPMVVAYMICGLPSKAASAP